MQNLLFKLRKTTYRIKSAPTYMNTPFEWAPLFTAEKLNEGPHLNKRPLKPGKGHSFAMSAEVLSRIVCKNDETRVFLYDIGIKL